MKRIIIALALAASASFAAETNRFEFVTVDRDGRMHGTSVLESPEFNARVSHTNTSFSAEVSEIVEPMVSAERADRIASIVDVRDTAWEGYTVDGIYTPGIKRNTLDINVYGQQITYTILPRLDAAEQDISDLNDTTSSHSSQLSTLSQDLTNETERAMAAESDARTIAVDEAYNAIHGNNDAEFNDVTLSSSITTPVVDAGVVQGKRVQVVGNGGLFTVGPSVSIVVSGDHEFSEYGLPMIGEWARSPGKPTYTYDEIGGTFPGITNACVNGTTGAVTNGVAYVRVSGIDGGGVTNIVRDLAYGRIPEIAVHSNRWAQITDPGRSFPSAYSGAVTNWVGGDLVLIYTNAAAAGSFTLDSAATVRILCVGGGGSGGNQGGNNGRAAGGGAGGFLEMDSLALPPGDYAVGVGAGGAGVIAAWGSAGAVGNDGGDSFVRLNDADIARALGGGGGGANSLRGHDGGCGGGGYVGGVGSGKQSESASGGSGKDGGAGYSAASAGGGGGGAGIAGGGAGANNGGAGGAGLESDITGSAVVYAGGGGGAGVTSGGAGGAGGGGAGSSGSYTAGSAGTDGQGGGGGGCSSGNNGFYSGHGGSGIVVVRFVRPPVRVVPYTLTSDLGDATNAIWQVLGAVNALLESAINGGN